jgi:DNA topoisomerase-2
MGRRVSKKIGAGSNRKRKDDDDYAPEKKPRAKAKPATAKAAPKIKTETTSAKRFAEMFSPKTKKEPKDDVMDLSDHFSDDDFAALSKSKPKAANVPELSQSASQSQSEEPEVFRPTKRAAASKAKTLFEVSSDSEGEDVGMIGDIASMVKGIGKPAGESSGRLSLYAMNRPESSQGNSGPSGSQKLKTKASKSSMDIDSHDETNYEMLAKSSPHKMKDEGEAGPGSDDELGAVTAPLTADSGLVAIKKARAKPAASKAKAKTESKPRPKTAPKATTTLSPAAKAYAARKKVIGVKKSVLESDDEIAEPSSPVSKPKPAARGRPGRAAAAKRPIIVDEDSSLMQDESDDPFEMDDD